jgi:hypothetical protein
MQDTTYGLAVSAGVIEKARVVQASRTAAAEKAAATKQAAETERVVRRQLKSATFKAVLYTISPPRFDWNRLAGRGGFFNAAQMKVALQEWTDNPKVVVGKAISCVITELKCSFKKTVVSYIVTLCFNKQK